MKKINPEVHRAVANAGLPLKQIRSRTKPWFQSDKTFETLLELNIEENIRKAGGAAEELLIVDGEVMASAIMKKALQVSLWSCLDFYKRKRLYCKYTNAAFMTAGNIIEHSARRRIQTRSIR